MTYINKLKFLLNFFMLINGIIFFMTLNFIVTDTTNNLYLAGFIVSNTLVVICFLTLERVQKIIEEY